VLSSGAGVPQITAIAECSKATRGTGVPLIADGGIKYSGDVTKAIAAGADCVMIGSLVRGDRREPGETILYQGRTFKSYRGMGSMGAMTQGSSERYSQETSGKLVPEGIEGRVPIRACWPTWSISSWAGCAPAWLLWMRTISELRENARFVRVTSAGLRESHVHDVIITKERPTTGWNSVTKSAPAAHLGRPLSSLPISPVRPPVL